MPPSPINENLELANQFVLHTNRSIFLTGKAGTGKTTFLHQIKQLAAKRLVVVAPTGVAAINAGGVTIHSLFQLPFGPLVPGAVFKEARRFSREKINIFRTLDLLVIDEISMVRADILDGIDEVLRRYRSSSEPFGGVQLLLIGDMQQLPPVIRDEDWALLGPHYETGYFFGSRALRSTSYVSIELTHIYRQRDERFISLLNGIREKTITPPQLAELNQRYIPDFSPPDQEGYITLSTHNNTAQQINTQKLAELKKKLHRFTATVEGEFPAHTYPTEAELELKVGAQVMFIKNDISREKLYYNGKIGQITAIEDEGILVKCGYETIPVGRVAWENIRYTLDPATKEIKSDVIGTFTQFPLKLAWAITIHKSQGLTFEKAIIDASAAFAHGQVYVALSRCKTLDGLVLRTPIPSHSIKTEATLEDFHEQVQQQLPTEQHLTDAKRHNQETLLRELFTFERANGLLSRVRRVGDEHANSLSPDLPPLLTQLSDTLRTKAREVAHRFGQQLTGYFADTHLPEANEPLQERIRKAGAYFLSVLTDDLLPIFYQLPTDTDNKQVRESLLEALDELEKELVAKQQSLTQCQNRFVALTYLQARNHAELDFVPARKKTQPVTEAAGGAIKGGLYGALMRWRNEVAADHNASAYMVLPQKTIVDLARIRPTTLAELAEVKGFGKTKVRQIGPQVLAIIADWVTRPTEAKPLKIKKLKEPKTLSHSITLAFFQSGMNIAAIAAERNLASSTVESHLAQCVSMGEIAVESLLPAEKISLIRAYLDTHQPGSTTEVIDGLAGAVTYGEVRFVISSVQASE